MPEVLTVGDRVRHTAMIMRGPAKWVVVKVTDTEFFMEDIGPRIKGNAQSLLKKMTLAGHHYETYEEELY